MKPSQPAPAGPLETVASRPRLWPWIHNAAALITLIGGLIAVTASVTGIAKEWFGAAFQSAAESAVRSVVPVIAPDTGTFTVSQTAAVYLVDPDGDLKPLGVSSLDEDNGILIVSFDDKRETLYMGSVVESGACRVTLVEIDEAGQEAVFDYRC